MPLTQQQKILALRIATGTLIVFLLVAALGLTSAYNALRFGITGLFIVLAILAFDQKYTHWSVGLVAGAVLFNPVVPIHLFDRGLWVFIDMIALAVVSYFAYWSTNPYQKGIRFEEYVSSLFPEPKFTIQDRTRDISKFAHRLVESDTHPDFVFRNNENNRIFAVECKWRNNWATHKGATGLYWKKYQQDAYMQYERTTGIPVVVAFGIGGTPQRPHKTYFVRLTSLQHTFINKAVIESGKTPEMMRVSV